MSRPVERPLRVFVLEYVTGGGMRRETLPASLAAEARLIRDAMVRDLADLPCRPEIVTARDDRLPGDGGAIVGADTDAWRLWADLARAVDVVWPVAPETGGVLAELVRMLGTTGARVIASTPEAIAAATSKSETARRLAAAGLPHIPTFPFASAPPLAGARVTKPDDGTGCAETRLWPAGTPATPGTTEGLVIQPHVAGEAASLTVQVAPGATRLLAANRQHIAEKGGHLFLAGLTVGAFHDTDGRLAALAEQVTAAFPGLSGIIGIDLILTAAGPVVVEVNPRLTTAYAGLRAALGVNPAALLPELAGPAHAPMSAEPRRPVELVLA